MKVVSVEELQKHTKKSDVWIAVRGKVYDVTKWLDDHPGGVEVLMDCCGRDATTEFNDVGHSNYAVEQAEKFLVGKLDGAVATTETPKDPWEVRKPARNSDDQPASDDSGAYLAAVGVATAALALAVYLIRS